MQHLPPLILASRSPRRAELLRGLGLEFMIVPSEANEVETAQLTVREIVQLNACRKARAVARKFPDALVLGADTLVCLGTAVFGKPANMSEAGEMLQQLQGRTHEVVTGVCLMHLRKSRQKLFAESTAVAFRALGAAQIRDYLARINPLDKAGAYAIQEHGEEIIQEISGSFRNVVGLPVERLEVVLRSWNEPPPA